ncbi:diacylglycerol kinase [Fluoribacter dumoffii]|uniref:Diacylglycerol kinase n=1 Tax=Fluoribacter dumoffii TaxID=463 RepID=A0A377G6I8_9GAMM|nr:diacylglycerol kinase [Fluoribacter dumoffii]KTC92416.1 diacylglycerol kinase [Fluoribacter dumoffii NY 23]MCW8386992.1 diacylglycerol kinase [Fluoribacter dumoffii]MCW8417505.1 diacylglycerol kinase [Fluoribacter dumoffii]MCW8454653.1 diacylglycerol kinase [Fluoribacter dumoffii]MCW8461269.1 diacylglycerol kinase [Fluoribacter dumoffii]
MFKFIVKALLKIKEASGYSFAGLKAAFQDEYAFRLELLAGVIALPAAIFIGKTSIERALLISTLLLVLIAELLNSAVETTLNRIDRAWNPLTKKAKDLGSAAVFLTIINALVVWILIIISRFQG